MPRPLRINTAGYLHHVISRGNDRQTLFKSSSDFLKYLQLLEEARRTYPLKIYNYVLMDNHVHLLIEPIVDGALSKAMEHVTKEYAKYFNKTYGHVGHVFQGRFKSFLVQSERYFFACSRYIDLNPVRAGLVSDPAHYQWSAYKTLVLGQKSEFGVDTHDLIERMGNSRRERQVAYRAFVLNYQGEEFDLMNQRVGILGDREFKRRLREMRSLK